MGGERASVGLYLPLLVFYTSIDPFVRLGFQWEVAIQKSQIQMTPVSALANADLHTHLHTWATIHPGRSYWAEGMVLVVQNLRAQESADLFPDSFNYLTTRIALSS